VNTSADGGDVSWGRLSSDGCGLIGDDGWLGCDGSGLGGNRGLDGRHAGYNAQGVGLGEVVDGRGVLEAY
jgi:hypothetical protein